MNSHQKLINSENNIPHHCEMSDIDKTFILTAKKWRQDLNSHQKFFKKRGYYINKEFADFFVFFSDSNQEAKPQFWPVPTSLA